MKDNIQKVIQETLEKKPSSAAVQEAVNRILGEDIESGDTVVSIHDDETFPYQGVQGKAKGPSAKGSGFIDVQFPDGTVVPLQASLLLKRS